MTEPIEGMSISVRADWVDLNDVPVLAANAFLGVLSVPNQTGVPDGLVVCVGHANAPVFVGTEEQNEAQLRALSTLPVTVLARYSISRDRLVEMIGTLTEAVRLHDQATQQVQQVQQATARA